LQVMNFSSTGALQPAEGASTTFEPLIRSSTASNLMNSIFFKDLTDPTILIDEFQSEDRRYAIAARVTGELHTAFPDGQPAAEVAEEDSEDAASDAEVADAETAEEAASSEPAEADMPNHLSESVGIANIIIV